MDVIVETLRRLDLFAALTPFQLTEIARNADRVVFNPGDAILTDGEECDAATVIVSGDAVCLRDAQNHPAGEMITPGSILAEMAMVVDIEAGATVIAQSRVRAVRISRTAMLELFQDEPEIAEAFLDEIMGRLRHVADHLRLIEEQMESDAGPGDHHRQTTEPVANVYATTSPLH